MTARLWIVRHGNTFQAGDPSRRIGARTDLPLTDAGRAQAVALHDRFAADRVEFGAVLSGPLSRTRETARIVAGTEAEIAPWLVEVDHGPDEDANEAAVTARIGRAALSAWDAGGVAPPGWIVDTDARLAAWRDLFARARGDVLLVTSNGAARFALLALDERPASLKLRTGAWGLIEIVAAVPRLVEWDVRP
ncbi:histidine phosphatase family protein [Sphingomonas sp.]|uniref:histidine phosphatase family protein n=1 Tax=Sphingomonas sp. TaxID=28214 RepID=UPI003B0091EA